MQATRSVGFLSETHGPWLLGLEAARPACRPCAPPVGPPFRAGDSLQPAQVDAGAAFPLWGSCDAPVLCPLFSLWCLLLPATPLPPCLPVLVCRALLPAGKSSRIVQGLGVLLPETLTVGRSGEIQPCHVCRNVGEVSLGDGGRHPRARLLCGSRAAASGAESDLSRGHR